MGGTVTGFSLLLLFSAVFFFSRTWIMAGLISSPPLSSSTYSFPNLFVYYYYCLSFVGINPWRDITYLIMIPGAPMEDLPSKLVKSIKPFFYKYNIR